VAAPRRRRQAASAGRGSELGEAEGWSGPLAGPSRPTIQLCFDLAEPALGDPGEVHALEEVLAEYPVGALVRASLPGAAGFAGVDRQTRRGGELEVA
jgi:hypothetical protein